MATVIGPSLLRSELWSSCIDMDTGAAMSCSPGVPHYGLPFSIDGSNFLPLSILND